MPIRAVLLHQEDDVASVLTAVEEGDLIEVETPNASEPGCRLIASEAIPFGHKIAVHELSAGAIVRKYGAPIGRLKQDVQVGAHVHVHNLQGLSVGMPDG